MIDFELLAKQMELLRLVIELNNPIQQNCPARPCHRCRRNSQCETLLTYRKEHPEYDVKFTSYETTRKQIESSLCKADDCEQVSQQECYPSNGENILGYRRPIMKIDFSEVKEAKLIPEGIADLTIKAAKEQKSKNGNMMLVVDFVDAEEGFTRDNLLLEGAGAFKMDNFLKACGLTKEDAEGMEATDFVGMNVTAEITHEEYEGVVRSKIKKYIA